MKRRGFLGLLGAGAVAGPSIAKNAVVNAMPLTGNMVLGNIPMDLADTSPLGSPHGSGLIGSFERITKLTKLISGEEIAETSPWDEGTKRRVIIEQRIHALGSVSVASKMRMLMRENARIEAETQKKYWLRELLDLQKKNLLG